MFICPQMYTSKWGKTQYWQSFDTKCGYNPKEVGLAFLMSVSSLFCFEIFVAPFICQKKTILPLAFLQISMVNCLADGK